MVILRAKERHYRNGSSKNAPGQREGEDDVADYEKMVRRKTGPGWDEREAVARLPVKGDDGTVVFDEKVVRRKSPAAIAAKEAERQAAAPAEMQEAGADGDNKKKSKGELAWERKQEEKRRAIAAIRRLPISGKLDAMAAAAQAVLADPDWHLAGIKPHDDREYAEFKRSRREGEKSKKELVGKWETLMLLANDAKPKVQRYAILSIVAVFKDVLPDYRIRLPTAKEREVRTTKEVRIQRKRERALLTTYQSYLKMLERLVQDASAPASVRAACVKAMCALFLEKPGFNFGANILKVLVPNMNSPIEAISEQCTACIATMFQTDANADSSLATVRAISKMVQAHKNGMDGKIRVGTIRTLLALPLSADLKNAARAMQAEKRKREAKKKKKKAKRRGQEDISKELAEANTAPDHIAKYTAQAQTLREVFLLYLRVLKRAPTSPLLPEVLEGVSKFIHLVNLDLARDLVNVMVELCDTRPERKYRLAPRAVMQCILTVGLALKGPGKELKVDEGAFCQRLPFSCRVLRKMPPPNYHLPKTVCTISLRVLETSFVERATQTHSRRSRSGASTPSLLRSVPEFLSRQ